MRTVVLTCGNARWSITSIRREPGGWINARYGAGSALGEVEAGTMACPF
jgi:hypothetical protein